MTDDDCSAMVLEGQEVVKAMQERLMRTFAGAKFTPRRGEDVQQFLRRQTHIYLQNQGLQGQLLECLPDMVPNACAVYLYSNQLSDVSALCRLSALRMLYLQVSGFCVYLCKLICCFCCPT